MSMRVSFLILLWALAVRPSAWAEPPSVSPAFQAQAAAQIGCWRSRTQLYRAYVVVFCLETDASGLYRVQGDGYDCQGRSTWTSDGRRFSYQMQRGFCRPGSRPDAAWTADRIECGAVPNRSGDLDCNYYPNAPGGNYQPSSFTAFRRR